MQQCLHFLDNPRTLLCYLELQNLSRQYKFFYLPFKIVNKENSDSYRSREITFTSFPSSQNLINHDFCVEINSISFSFGSLRYKQRQFPLKGFSKKNFKTTNEHEGQKKIVPSLLLHWAWDTQTKASAPESWEQKLSYIKHCQTQSGRGQT